MKSLLLSMSLALAVVAPATAAERDYPSMTASQAAGIEPVTNAFFRR